MVKGVVDMLNDFPSVNGVSQTMSPASIATDKCKPDYNMPRISFDFFAMVYIGTTNNMKSRAVPSIALNASNERGGNFFMSINTGIRIHSHKWKELPIIDEVINVVESLAKKEGAKLMPKGMPMFEWAPEIEINDSSVEVSEQENDANDNEDDVVVSQDDHNVVSGDEDEDDEENLERHNEQKTTVM